jgi:hypothetical protein
VRCTEDASEHPARVSSVAIGLGHGPAMVSNERAV